MTQGKEQQYSEDELKQRMEAALRGARLAAPMPMKDIPPKRAKKSTSKQRAKESES